MEGVGDGLLTRAAFALDEDGRVAPGRGLDDVVNAAHGLAVADELVHAAHERQLLLEPLLAVNEPAALERLPDEMQDLVRRERLGDVVVRAPLDRVDRGLDAALSGDHDDLDARPLTADAVEELEPAHPREGEVGEHQVGLLLLELRDRVDGVVDGKHAVALGAQRVAQRLAHGGVVIDDEDSRLGAHRFSSVPDRSLGRRPTALCREILHRT